VEGHLAAPERFDLARDDDGFLGRLKSAFR